MPYFFWPPHKLNNTAASLPETKPNAAPAPRTMAITAQKARWDFWYTLQCVSSSALRADAPADHLWVPFLLRAEMCKHSLKSLIPSALDKACPSGKLLLTMNCG
eukprot:1157809-Pelagomonas_calceolata.AAC.10